MRKGVNPAKLEKNITAEEQCFHQIIIPVYLPELKGYFREGLSILKLCLESLALTVHSKTFITVVNNGSCKMVKNYLNQLCDDKKIQEIIHTSAIGKINAIAKGLSGHNFNFVTITDADVLFKNDWQTAVYEIYKQFPKAGMVCTTPQSKRLKQYTESIYFDNLFNHNLKFRPVHSKDDLLKFAESVGNNKRFKNVHLERVLSIKKNDTIAVIGAGHFCATYKYALIKDLKSINTKSKLSSKTDKEFIDNPSVKYGHWRLSTYKNYTFHLGNEFENWMQKEFKKISNANHILTQPTEANFKKSRFFFLKRLFIRKLLFNKMIWKKYLEKLGLTKAESKIY